MKSEAKFYLADTKEIIEGKATDIYFVRTKKILEKKGLDSIRVRMELHAYSLPKGYDWALFTGLEEVIRLLEGKPLTVWSLPEGTVFKPYEPLLIIEGKYSDISVFETPILGILRHYTSISTATARVKRIAGDKTVFFFGLRALHPALQPMADRAAFIGGADGVSGVLSEKYLGIKPMGTMPHALIIIFGKQEEAWKAFDETMPMEVPRIALVDTFYDEQIEALMAANTLKDKLYGVRLDTPSSRRGDMYKIVKEVRWTLNIHGYSHVKIFVSGGVDEETVRRLRDLVDGFGVGTSIAFPKSVDISADIVELYKDNKWILVAKRGKMPGAKQLHICPNHIDVREIALFEKEEFKRCPKCNARLMPMLKKVLDNGEVVEKLPSIREIRKNVLNQLFKLPEP